MHSSRDASRGEPASAAGSSTNEITSAPKSPRISAPNRYDHASVNILGSRMITQPPEKPALEYEYTSARFATRRQFRLLLALVLLNLLITVQTAYWPGLVHSFKTQWTDYQQHRRER